MLNNPSIQKRSAFMKQFREISSRAIPYGAKELKEYQTRSAAKGFILTLMMLAILLVLNLMINSRKIPVPAQYITTTTDFIPDDIIRIIDETEPYNKESSVPPATVPKDAIKEILSGTGDKAGNFIPVEADKYVDDGKDIATVDKQGESYADGREKNTDNGNGTGTDGGDRSVISTAPAPEEEMEFIPVEVMPSVDMNALRKAVEYPPLARRVGIEGEVIIGILIGKDGGVLRTKILDSDSELLNQAAEDAVRKVRFTPARQNGESVECWVTIPINFEIR